MRATRSRSRFDSGAREQERPEFGRRLLDRLAAGVGENGIVEQTPQQEGRLMTMVIAPSRRKRKAESVPGTAAMLLTQPVKETAAPVTDDRLPKHRWSRNR